MNLIRSLKLLSLNDNLTDQERFVISLFDDLNERKSKNLIEYISGEGHYNYCIEYFIQQKEFIISGRLVWEVIENHFCFTYQETNNLIRSVLEKALHTKDFAIYKDGKYVENSNNDSYIDDYIDDDYYL